MDDVDAGDARQSARRRVGELHARLLRRALERRRTDPEFRFILRTRDTSGRLSHGYRFNGNDSYLSFSPFAPRDSNNKTGTIGFEVHLDPNGIPARCALSLAYSSVSDPAELALYEKLSEVLALERHGDRRYRKLYSEPDPDTCFDRFLGDDYPKIRSAIEHAGLTERFIISENRFLEMLEGSMPPSRDLCLLGTWRNVGDAEVDRVGEVISHTGAWANWWSFPIRQEFTERLKGPFWLYLNSGNATIVCRMRVDELRTTSDVDGIESPWPEHTEPDQRGKRRIGDRKSEVFRTWFRVTAIERLSTPLKLSDFEPAEGTTESALLNQSAFGYAYLKRAADETGETTQPATNLILYGPPGTGKTFALIERALRLIEPDATFATRDAMQTRFRELQEEGRILSVAFHPSYTYEEFVEGLRPVRTTEQDGSVGFEVVPGPLKLIAAKATLASERIDEHIAALEQRCSEADGSPVSMQTPTGRSFKLTYRGGRTFRVRPANLDPDAPDYSVSIDAIRRVHGGADYRDEYNPSYVRGVLDHLYANGLSRTARRAAFQPCVLIIDEINRGNLAKIFGELITLLEPDKRLGAPEALRLRLPYSRELFGLPSTVSVIATMNTADRSIALLDIALRRRFRFEEIAPQPDRLGVVDTVDLRRLLEVINRRLTFFLDRDHRIGHAYFMQVHSLAELVECFRFQIIPLLQEYFFDDWSKVHLVLSTAAGNSPFVKEMVINGDKLFPGNRSESVQSDRVGYEITPPENWDAACFRGIYEHVEY